jgi:ubiquinone/menaquinone biosynthesis C-methylase UbiE
MNVEKSELPQPFHPRGFVGRITAWGIEKVHGLIYKTVAEVLHLVPEDDLVEVACGTGHFLKKYASHVHSVAGLDHSELMVKLATRKHRDRIKAGTAVFVQGEASQLPWQDKKFSVATTMGSIIVFPKPLEALKEMYRVLRPGGRAVVSIEVNAEDGKDHSKDVEKYGMWVWTEDDVRTMFEQAGFSEVSISYAKGTMLASAVKR